MQQLPRTDTINEWSFIEKILFRFSFLFFGIYIFPFPLNFLSFLGKTFSFIDATMNWLVVFTGKYILHLPYDITVQPNGSGDTTWNYVQLFIMVMFALIGCIIWSIADTHKKNYNMWLYWLTVGVRYYLAFSFIVYGSFKVFKTQFPSPSISRLLEPYGDSSPMGLAWTFLGYSKGYNYFMGLAEIIGGMLLLFRKTKTFGALFSMTVTCNIVAINLCFDVPVKLYSLSLLAMAVFIAAPEIGRLYQFFFSHKTTTLKFHGYTFKTKWKRITAFTIKALLILYILITYSYEGINNLKQYGDDAPKPKLYGYYNVVTFVKNRDTLPPLLTDTTRWNKLLFREYDRITIKMMNDTLMAYNYKDDSLKHELQLTQRDDTTLKYNFIYNPIDKTRLELRSMGKDSIYMQLSKIEVNDFLLMKRGFHWINEYPLNR
jgi:uncharacterized membrane protein YphA (DoxX/SURF4 family)